MSLEIDDADVADTSASEPEPAEPQDHAPGRDPVRTVLVAVIALALLVTAVAGGYVLRGDGGSPVTDASVDAGFARDMSTHHTQAVIMAGYARDHTTDPAVKTLAYDIEYAQNQQIGTMGGWLDAWGLARTTTRPVMAWMGGVDGMAGMDMGQSASAGPTGVDDGSNTSLMPGMATPAELAKLETMTGKAMDVYFLQLMLRHHKGGIAMAQYAVAHAELSYVQRLAQNMVATQQNEVTVMTDMLTARGAKPL